MPEDDEWEGKVNAHQRLHRLRCSTKLYPRRQFDLHALLAKELGLRRKPKRKNWLAIALSMSVFAGGITIVTQVAPGADEKQELSDRIREYKQIQLAEITLSTFSKTKALAIDWRNASPLSIGLLFEPASVSLLPENIAKRAVKRSAESLPIEPIPTTRTALSLEARLELELWRPLAHSGDTDRYRAYLRRYPSRAFAEIAITRIEELRESARQAALRKGDSGIAKKKANSSTLVTAKPQISAKVAALTPSAQESRPAKNPGPKLRSVGSPNTRPSVPVKSAAVAISAQNTTGRCREAITARCRESLTASKKECIHSESNTMPSKLCFIHNYQSSTKTARQPH